MEWATNSISPQTEVVHNLGCIKKYPTTAAELRPTWLWRWKCTGERGQETSEPDGQEVSQWRDPAFHISKVFSQKLFKKKTAPKDVIITWVTNGGHRMSMHPNAIHSVDTKRKNADIQFYSGLLQLLDWTMFSSTNIWIYYNIHIY